MVSITRLQSKEKPTFFQLLRKLGNILIRNLTGMLSRLDRIVLGRQAISIETDGEQDIIALHPSLSGDNLQAGVGLI